MANMSDYKITRVKKDKSVPPRYQRSGWIVFDAKHPHLHHPFFETRSEAVDYLEWLTAELTPTEGYPAF